MRLQIFLSRSGACSRRRALDLIKQGAVSVNNRIVREPSFQVRIDKERVFLNGRQVKPKECVYLMLNKPKGFVTTRYDRHAEHTVMELLPARYRHLHPAGRLDKDTEGLLFFTNDGKLSYRLTHPKFNIDKKYFVRIEGGLRPADKSRLERGIMLEGKKTAPCKIKILHLKKGITELEVTLHEGRKRQIRLMFQRMGYGVMRLMRTEIGPLRMGNLASGKFRALSRKELTRLQALPAV